MKYQQIQPPDYLKNYVRHYWVLESDQTDVLSQSFRTIADGCPGLIFQQPDKGVLFQNDKELPGIILYGQATRHAEIKLKGKFSTVGIYFYPSALKSIFGLNAGELTDTCLDLDLLAGEQGYYLLEQLADTPALKDQIAIISAYLLFMIRKNSTCADDAMQYALSSIVASKGSISMKTLHEQLHLSERSFERKFKQYVGISPKLFSRISRFQASLSQLRTNSYDKLSDIAFGNDYADQSHFIRSFKEFAGVSPYQYQKLSTEVMENFTTQTK
ncbi:helix-turn-helix domain-containing protein [Chitinophaga nivalis]|uniref:Helix-turn-helix domain-containing protein n=1 Tax=Chitinophaga nivalis TaxID=2991709 RepID=A0ABT3IS34_9BACT|nr:helix-turn-helix domain-containing protein [Chitinophaga nivalis]MCW3463523.1 helix-turn-helix domain-containing protein [Chitinophaga nivalis]MCW3486787.1 helix-turn-helix domain-containing protein [Chitinophaga nivalis]